MQRKRHPTATATITEGRQTKEDAEGKILKGITAPK